MNSYGIFAQYYDDLMDLDYNERLYNTYCNILKENNITKGIVLDLACGTGNLTLKLEENGYDCIGIDSSWEMLSVAKEKSVGKDITYICQDIANFDLYGTVNAVTCALDSLNHITDVAALQRIFERAALFLEPKGLFIFDVNTVYKHWVTLSDNTFVFEQEDLFLIWQNHTEQDLTELTLDFFIKNGSSCKQSQKTSVSLSQNKFSEVTYKRYTENFFECGYDYQAIKDISDVTGFEIISALDFEKNKKINSETERGLYIIQKK